MNDEIRHDGIIEKILDDRHIQVRIVQTSACAACKIAGYCSSAESKEKTVDVWANNTSKYSVGQNVTVLASMKTGRTAVLIGFALPAVLILVTVAGMLQFLPDTQSSQAVAALCGLAILIPYYICLYFFRDLLREKFSFSIE